MRTLDRLQITADTARRTIGSPRAASIRDEWPVARDEVDVPTEYGKVHVIVSGPGDGILVLLFHAASMAAVSWAPNVASLSAAGFRTYAVDYIGEAGRSVLDDIDVFPKRPAQTGRLYPQLAERLGLGSGPAIGASAGGHAAMRYALEAPDRVTRLALLGPMGVVPLGFGAVTRMMLASTFPSERRIASTNRWALGGSPNIPDFPNIRVEVARSGHLVGVEQADAVNR